MAQPVEHLAQAMPALQHRAERDQCPFFIADIGWGGVAGPHHSKLPHLEVRYSLKT
ncbi:hypothetical protein [Methylobacterium frigidaeris]|uniref:Uncharacterized protein n=1 Tax=Methylobacterium frigidaeris TaxID=2038277 RepID=A0AA37HDZ9_9HYPH|nr:hypothetical protein MPEAHAMD_4442 [Methylobacterium frigidaeris]